MDEWAYYRTIKKKSSTIEAGSWKNEMNFQHMPNPRKRHAPMPSKCRKEGVPTFRNGPGIGRQKRPPSHFVREEKRPYLCELQR